MKSRSILTACLVLASLASLAVLPDSRAADEKAREEEAFQLGIEAYVFGYPLVLMDVTKRVMTNVPSATRKAAPVNQFHHAPRFPDHTFKEVVSPNADTLYSIAWLDVSKEPIVLHVPDTAGRYYLMPLLDAWTNVFASPGKRTTGTKEGSFAVVGPGWKGKLPEGVQEVRSPTSMVWLIGRTQTNGKADYEAVHALQRRCTLTPLSAHGKAYVPPAAVPVDPRVDMKTPPAKQVANMDAATFFARLTHLMRDNPPAAADAPAVRRFKAAGIAPGKDLDWNRLPAATRRGLERAVQAAQLKIQIPSATPGTKIENGWLVQRRGIGAYGTDYQRRAFIARIALGVNLLQDALYPLTKVDDDGNRLSGANRYRIHFAKGQTPPAHAFWSLTMYGMNQSLVANPLDRYALGDRDPLHYNPDGSLDLHLQHQAPGTDRQSNWLPAPEGEFNLILRIYWPKEAALDGSWTIPAVQRVK